MNPTFELVRAPKEDEPLHDPDLAALADSINKFVTKEATPYLEAKRASTGLGNLQLTAHIGSKGLTLCYAWQRPDWKPAHPPQWILGGRFWLWLSRVVYRMTHRRPAIPAEEYGKPSPTRPKGPRMDASVSKTKAKKPLVKISTK